MNATGSRTTRTPLPPPPPDSGSALTRAWIAIALIPVFFLVAFAVGEGLTSLLGYPVGGSNPIWVTLLSDLAALIAVLLPCLAAVFYANRARKSGNSRAIVPLVIGSIAGLGLLILTIVSEVGDLLR